MKTQCQWFALCENEATTTRPHPILGDVPICQRCDEKVARIEAATRRDKLELPKERR